MFNCGIWALGDGGQEDAGPLTWKARFMDRWGNLLHAVTDLSLVKLGILPY